MVSPEALLRFRGEKGSEPSSVQGRGHSGPKEAVFLVALDIRLSCLQEDERQLSRHPGFHQLR